MSFITVYVSRFSNDKTKPRLYSPLILNKIGPLENPTGFRFQVSPKMTKAEIVKQCSNIVFDKRPEVNATMFISSIIMGWAYRVKISEVYPKSVFSEITLVKYLFPMLRTLLKNPYKENKIEKSSDGWIKVNKSRNVSKSKSAYCYARSMIDNATKKHIWKGIFDLNFQLTIISIAMADHVALKEIQKKFQSKLMTLRGKDIFNREVNKYKLFIFLTSYY